MFNGLEIDMMSIGDADCILVSQWSPVDAYAFRVLVDGGSKPDAKQIREFLVERGATHVYAVVCTHPHNDHASGLIELIKNRSVTCTTAWMHDIRNHISPEALRRASSGNSSQADAVKQVLETTRELASAFATQGIIPNEPFSGNFVSALPCVTVLGPSLAYYGNVLKEFTEEPIACAPAAPFSLAQLLGKPTTGISPGFMEALFNTPRQMSNPLPLAPLAIGSPLSGILGGSSVKENPSTQPFNNSSVILGVLFNGQSYLLTADAGCDALRRIPAEWKALKWMQVPHHGSDGNLSQELIERFCPRVANISAKGDSSHPSRAIVSGLVKVGAQVFSTHLANPGHLWYHDGNVPCRLNYSPAVPMKGTGSPGPPTYLSSLLGRSAG